MKVYLKKIKILKHQLFWNRKIKI